MNITSQRGYYWTEDSCQAAFRLQAPHTNMHASLRGLQILEPTPLI